MTTKKAEDLQAGETILFHSGYDPHIEEVERVYIPFNLSSLRSIQFANGKVLRASADQVFELITDADRVDYIPEHKYTEDYRP